MEFPALEHPAKVAVIVGRPAVRARQGVPPGAHMIGAVLRLQKANHDHLAHGFRPPACAYRGRKPGAFHSPVWRIRGLFYYVTEGVPSPNLRLSWPARRAHFPPRVFPISTPRRAPDGRRE